MTDAERGLVHAAGAVLWRPAAGGTAGAGTDGVQVALVHRPRYDDWSFPKGKQAPGEHILVTATREVAEETGVTVRLGRCLASTSYETSDGHPKLVDYWVARPEHPGGHDHSQPFTPCEVDQVAWLGLAAARDRLSYARDVGVLDGFAAGPRESIPVILLRHANAVSKQQWHASGHRDDLARPLSGQGRAQAGALADVLACFPPARVVSSTARRCLETVSPYAELVGAVAEGEQGFEVDGSEAAERGRLRVIEAVTGTRPVVICAHRENLTCMLEVACERLGAPVPAGPPLRKGSFWVLHVSAGQLVCAEQHDVDSAYAAQGAGS
ncbi:MAG TPA: NUDIX hydrolase [Streptosporangiaceae bacterium]|nr:NUDIX hydrolase [Streptosporangiaceae bacterium]